MPEGGGGTVASLAKRGNLSAKMSPIASQEPVSRKRPLPFTEEPAWRAVGEGWRHLHGGFRTRGMSFEWHDFECSAEFDWARSFHPESVEICLNLTGSVN